MFTELESYIPSPMESFIIEIYRNNGIRNPQDIDLEMFAYNSSIWIHYRPVTTQHHEHEGMYSVIVDERLPWEQQRVELAHELGHVLLHAGNQNTMPNDFRVLQEWQADRFAAFALTPTFMLANCIVQAHSRQQLVRQLAYTFDVPDIFMDYRLKMLEQRIKDMVVRGQLAKTIKEQRAMYDYTYRDPFNPRLEYWVKDGRIVHTQRRTEL